MRSLSSILAALTLLTLGSTSDAQATRRAPVAKPSDPSPLSQRWDAELRGKRATIINRVNGGEFGGATSQSDFFFCRDGRVYFESASSVSVDVGGASGNSGGRERRWGVWRVMINDHGIPVLELTSDGETGYLGIGWNERGHTFFQGERAYVTEENDRCG